MRNMAKKEILDTFIILLRLRLHKHREWARVKETSKLQATVRVANQQSQKRSIPFQLFIDGKNSGMADKGERQDWHGVHSLKETHRCVYTPWHTLGSPRQLCFRDLNQSRESVTAAQLTPIPILFTKYDQDDLRHATLRPCTSFACIPSHRRT